MARSLVRRDGYRDNSGSINPEVILGIFYLTIDFDCRKMYRITFYKESLLLHYSKENF